MVTLHTIACVERFANLKDAAVRSCNTETIYQLEQENLLSYAIYNAACLNVLGIKI